MGPTEVVALRTRLLDSLSGPQNQLHLADWLRQVVDPTGTEPLTEAAAFEIGTLRSARLYLVTEDMRHLVVAAAGTLPSFRLHEDDLPAEAGLVVFDEAIDVAITFANNRVDKVAAFSWGTMSNADDPNETGVALTLWGPPEDFPGHDDGRDMPPLLPGMTATWWTRETWAPIPGEGGYQRWPAYVASFFRLIGEPYVTTEVSHPTRPNARRAQRAKIEDPTIRVVTLRRASGTPADKGTGGNWSRRWIVQGHWRQQWYPTQNRHAPRWIKPYVKGPDDKPLVAPETVNVWRR